MPLLTRSVAGAIELPLGLLVMIAFYVIVMRRAVARSHVPCTITADRDHVIFHARECCRTDSYFSDAESAAAGFRLFPVRGPCDRLASGIIV